MASNCAGMRGAGVDAQKLRGVLQRDVKAAGLLRGEWKKRDVGLLRANLTKKARAAISPALHLLFWAPRLSFVRSIRSFHLCRAFAGVSAQASPIAVTTTTGRSLLFFHLPFEKQQQRHQYKCLPLACHVCRGRPCGHCLHQEVAQDRGTNLLDFKASRNAWTSVRSPANSTRLSSMRI
jgi:hypothetical protein